MWLSMLLFISLSSYCQEYCVYFYDAELEDHDETPVIIEPSSLEYKLYIKIIESAPPAKIPPDILQDFPQLSVQELIELYELAESLNIIIDEEYEDIKLLLKRSNSGNETFHYPG